MKLRPPSSALVLALLASGCGPDAGSAAFSVRDSAGVRIAASTRPGWRPGQGWRVDSLPSLELRAGPGGPPREVRAAVILPSGTVVVGDGATQAVRWYGRRGRHLRSTRGDGGAAGEFVSLSALGVLDDGGVLAWDAATLRASAFDAEGRPRPSPPLPAEEIGHVEAVFGDGSLLAVGARSGVFVVSPVPRREPFALIRYSAAPPRVDTLRQELGPEEFTWGGEGFALRQPAPFGRRTFVAVRGRRLWIADNERFEVRTYDEDGRLLRIARAAVAPQAIDAAERERHRASLAARARGSVPAAAAESLLARLPFPRTYPAFADLRVDADGRAWLRSAAPNRAREWTVIDRNGRMLGPVEMPAGLEILDIGKDRVVGVWMDAHGTAHLRLHRIRR